MKKIFLIGMMLCVTSVNLYSQWITKDTGLNRRFMCTALVDSATCYLGGDNEVLLKTTDRGNSWISSSILSLNNITFHSLFFLDKMHGWGVTYAYDQYSNRTGKIVCTTNGGKIWAEQIVLNGYVLHSIYFVDTLRGWAVGSNGFVLNTTDGGKNWYGQTLSASWLYSVYFINNQTGWIVGNIEGSIFKTTDGGVNWLPINTQDSTWYFSVNFINQDTGWAAGINGTIIKTVDGGQLWQQENTNTNAELRKIYFQNPDTGWVVGLGGVLLNTKNGGDTWQKIQTGTNLNLYSVSVADNFIWVAGDSGLVMRGRTDLLNVTSISSNHSNIISQYEIGQNYPNPFNPSTIINYEIPKSSLVTLKVYDVLGREVATLVNEEKQAGRYNVTFNASKYSSGVYFYRITAGDFSQIKKMVLLK